MQSKLREGGVGIKLRKSKQRGNEKGNKGREMKRNGKWEAEGVSCLYLDRLQTSNHEQE
jgi:hypothetical protein